jgi:hypothetical protein
MNSIFIKRVAVVLSLAALIQGANSAYAKPKAKASTSVSYSILHAIPVGFGADIVDIYANGALVFDNATPGSIKSITTARGNLNLAIYANGVIPGPTTSAVLTATPIYLGNGSQISFVAHLSEDERPKLSTFRNMVTEAGAKRSWLTIRHIAAAPAVSARVNGSAISVPLTNSMERKRSLSFGTYSVDAVLPDTATVVVGPANVTVQKGVNTVLYVWGAKSKNNLAVFKQEITAKKS